MAILDYATVRASDSPYAALTAADLPALSTAPLAEQEQAFAATVLRNPKVRAVLERLAALDLPPWYLTAGALFQTVWNVGAGRDDLTHGILDLDLFFYDGKDLSYEAEDVVIKRCQEAVHDLDVNLEPRNQARVFLWYEAKFGRPVEQYRTLEEAVATFAFTCCSVALSLDSGGRLTIHTTHGYDDLFAGVLRPSPTTIAPREVYEAKAARYCEVWPQLTKIPWPADH